MTRIVLLGAVLAALLAPPAVAAPVTVEAETLGSPSSGGALQLSGTASGKLASRATRRISVRARAACAARLAVTVDGVGTIDTPVGSTWTEYAADRSLADGTHTLGLRRVSGSCPVQVDRVVATSVAARPLPGAALYVDPNSQARAAANAWRTSRPADAAKLDLIASRPQAFWFGGWNADVRADVDRVMTAAAGRVPVLVAYAIPQRDCGGYSAGGSGSPAAYKTWIRAFAGGIGTRRAIVIVEPDAVAGLDCLSAADRTTRLALLADAVRVLAALPGTAVYLDGGHDAWQSVSVMASRLRSAGIADAQGFALNVSNFRASPGLITYGQSVAATIGVTHFVIDTSRNGLGPAPGGAWCNPPGRALGKAPGITTDRRLDWNLWIKRPGESDGTCNGGPAAGVFWPDYALGLATRAGT